MRTASEESESGLLKPPRNLPSVLCRLLRWSKVPPHITQFARAFWANVREKFVQRILLEALAAKEASEVRKVICSAVIRRRLGGSDLPVTDRLANLHALLLGYGVLLHFFIYVNASRERASTLG
ncbi:MAG: hypothetical protein ACI9R3_004917 [Verrucomicrobiales bacterium]|jgi:hypothetical protein